MFIVIKKTQSIMTMDNTITNLIHWKNGVVVGKNLKSMTNVNVVNMTVATDVNGLSLKTYLILKTKFFDKFRSIYRWFYI